MGNRNRGRAAREAVVKYASKDLSHTEYLVLMEFAWHADADGGSTYPGNATIARNLRISERTVKRAKRALLEAGELVQAGRKGRNGPKVYTVAAAQRGEAAHSGPPVERPQNPVGRPQHGRGEATHMAPDLGTTRPIEARPGRAPHNGSSNGNDSVLSLHEALRAKGIDPQTGTILGTKVYLREVLELERREKEAAERERGAEAIRTVKRMMAEYREKKAA
jgi:Helix-turn-helix domain